MTTFPQKLKDPRTCRVFVSSPFGGLEREREELVARYFPQLSALCQAKGVHFVAVDMRWGITEEAATNNQVVNICLREIDRSDIFIGFFAQRYGWHGLKDDSLQQNIDLCVKRYPWLKTVRDRSVTEFEFLHGHLNKPGLLPAAFAFRAKAYDDKERAEARRRNDAAAEKKFSVEDAESEKQLTALINKVVKSKSKCLAVHVNYETPEEAARLLFEDMKGHLEKVLLKESVSQSPRDLELACHEAYMSTHTSLHVGGLRYMRELDNTLNKGGGGHLVLGSAGSGKGALVSNWLQTVRKRKTHELIYHFVGCSKDSTSVKGILERLTEELERISGEVKHKKRMLGGEEGDDDDGGDEEVKAPELSDLFQKLNVALGKASRKKKILIVIDGLAKVESLSRISKTLFWLPTDLPPKVVTVVVTCRDGNTDIIGELTERGYNITRMQPFTEQEKKDFCVGFLQQHSKELSATQLKTILDTKQAENPFYLKVVVAELCSFGNFRKLDSKISSLVKSQSMPELFEQFLVRMEEDYNTERGGGKNLIQQVMCSLTLAKKGLLETEIMDILNIPSATWSPIYFALKDFIFDQSGLLSLAFGELKEAVEKRYMPTKAERVKYLAPMIYSFQCTRKSFNVMDNAESVAVGRVATELTWLLRTLGDKEALVEVLTDITVFSRFFVEAEYELVELWQLTGKTQEQIVSLYMQAIDTRRKLLQQENLSAKDGAVSTDVIDMLVLSYLDALTYFMELNHFTSSVEIVLQQRLSILENLKGTKLHEDRRQRMMSMVKVKLSYILAQKGQFAQAQSLLEGVLEYRLKFLERSKGTVAMVAMKDLAAVYHAMGLLLSKSGHTDKAVEHYRQSMMLHEKLKRPVELADSMNNLGVMLMKKEDYSQAADLCSKALKIYEDQYFGHLPPIIGVMICNIAVCYRNLNRLDESEAMYKKAVEISERALGRNHPNVATALTNLGTLEVNRNDYAKAEGYFRDALDIYKACQTQTCNYDAFKTGEKHVYTLVKLERHEEAITEFNQLYGQIKSGAVKVPAWQTMWAEMMMVLLAAGKFAQVADIALFLMTSSGPSDVMLTFLDRADRGSKTKEKRPKELTVAGALEKNPGSQVLLAYQTQEVLIPAGKTEELLQVLDRSSEALGAGPNLYHAAAGWCQSKGQDAMTLGIMKHASDKFPGDANLASQVCGPMREKEQWEEGLPYAHRMLDAKPDDVHVMLFAGEFFIQTGHIDTANDIFNKAARLSKPGSNEHKQASSGLKIVEMMMKRRGSIQAATK